MPFSSDGLIIIGENLNATRKIKASSPRIVSEDGRHGLDYTDLDGTRRRLDVSDVYPEDSDNSKGALVPHIAHAIRSKNLDYLTWAIRAQEAAGARIIDVCVDEMSHYPEERMDWMRWLVKTAQSITDTVLSIDSSDPETIKAGLDAHDGAKSRPAINSVNLEENRLVLIDMAKERGAILFANAAGHAGMPADAKQWVENLTKVMGMMDDAGIPMEDRFIDPLVFPIGADSQFGNHYLDAVRELRAAYPDAHIFGGHSNASFGLPGRKALNHAFIILAILAILAGCDALMIDPILNPPAEFVEFRMAAEVQTGKDEYALKYLSYWRAQSA